MRASPAERGARKDVPAPHPVSVTEPGQRTGTMSNAEALRLTVQILDNLHTQIRAMGRKARSVTVKYPPGVSRARRLVTVRE